MRLGSHGPTSNVSRMLAKAGHTRSDCPQHKRLSHPETQSTGFIVWQSWDYRVLVKHNVHADEQKRLGASGTAALVRSALDAYEQTLQRLYHTSRDGDQIAIGHRK